MTYTVVDVARRNIFTVCPEVMTDSGSFCHVKIADYNPPGSPGSGKSLLLKALEGKKVELRNVEIGPNDQLRDEWANFTRNEMSPSGKGQASVSVGPLPDPEHVVADVFVEDENVISLIDRVREMSG